MTTVLSTLDPTDSSEVAEKGEPKLEAPNEVITTSQLSGAWRYGAAALLLVGALFQSRPLFALGLLLASALGVAWLWARWCLHDLRVERRLSQHRAFWGEEVRMSQVFTNAKPLPVPWLAVDDQFPMLEVLSISGIPIQKARRRQVSTALSLSWYERVTRHYTLQCTTRGEHEFGPVDIRSGDIFGLFRRSETIRTAQTLLVYPRYVPLTHLGLPARQPFGDSKALQPLSTDPLRFRAVREYAQGDSPRFVHWRASARRGVLQTKLFEPSATPQLFIFCNQDTFANVWEGIDRETLELTITVAASIANHALEEGYMVGLQVNVFAPSSDRQIKLLPSRDPNQLTRILEFLALVRGWSGLPMEELLRAERRTIPRGSTLVIVTGVVTAQMLDILVTLRRAGHPITLVETSASPRAAKPEHVATEDALNDQGITYYYVDAAEQGLEF